MYFKDDDFQNMFVYQATFSSFQLKKDKRINYIPSWKSKGVYSSTHFPQHAAFLHSIKLFGYEIKSKLDKDPLDAEQDNYATKIANVDIVYDLDTCIRNPLNTFTLTCLVQLIQ